MTSISKPSTIVACRQPFCVLSWPKNRVSREAIYRVKHCAWLH